jgi:hypothetical protein
MLYMFRTVLVHLQERLYTLYIAFGICRYVWLLCGYSRRFSFWNVVSRHWMVGARRLETT